MGTLDIPKTTETLQKLGDKEKVLSDDRSWGDPKNFNLISSSPDSTLFQSHSMVIHTLTAIFSLEKL